MRRSPVVWASGCQEDENVQSTAIQLYLCSRDSNCLGRYLTPGPRRTGSILLIKDSRTVAQNFDQIPASLDHDQKTSRPPDQDVS